MIKKLSLFFSAIAIGILSIFGSISTKNTAEPQYFLENKQVKKRVIQENSNIVFYLDNLEITTYNGFSLDDFAEYDSEETSDILLYTLDNEVISLKEYADSQQIIINWGGISFQEYENRIEFFMSSEDDFRIQRYTDNIQENWTVALYLNDYGSIDQINKFELVNFYLLGDNTIESINTALNPYIGNLPNDQIPPLEQINTLVSDIVNWFTNIFNGLGNVFYDPTANKLTAWGTVMFIGVAIMLISMALKWVISLIRGV